MTELSQIDPLELKLAGVAAIGAAAGVVIGALIVLLAIRSARARTEETKEIPMVPPAPVVEIRP